MDENLQQQPKKDFQQIDKEEMELDEEAKYEGLDLGLKDLEQEKQKLLLKAKMSYNRFLKKKVEIRLAKIIIEELKEVEENKLRIDKEIEGLEARIAGERECLEYEDWDVVEKRIEPIKKELAEMEKLQKFAEERLAGIKKKKLEEINSKKKETVRVVQLNGEEGLKVLKIIKSLTRVPSNARGWARFTRLGWVRWFVRQCKPGFLRNHRIIVESRKSGRSR